MSCCGRQKDLSHLSESTKMVMLKRFSDIPKGADITNKPLWLKWKLLDLKYAEIIYD